MTNEQSSFYVPEPDEDKPKLGPVDLYVAQQLDKRRGELVEAIAFYNYGPNSNRADLVVNPIPDTATEDEKLGMLRVFELLKLEFTSIYPGWIMERTISDTVETTGSDIPACNFGTKEVEIINFYKPAQQ
jgi:hypothetical protein